MFLVAQLILLLEVVSGVDWGPPDEFTGWSGEVRRYPNRRMSHEGPGPSQARPFKGESWEDPKGLWREWPNVWTDGNGHEWVVSLGRNISTYFNFSFDFCPDVCKRVRLPEDFLKCVNAAPPDCVGEVAFNFDYYYPPTSLVYEHHYKAGMPEYYDNSRRGFFENPPFPTTFKPGDQMVFQDDRPDFRWQLLLPVQYHSLGSGYRECEIYVTSLNADLTDTANDDYWDMGGSLSVNPPSGYVSSSYTDYFLITNGVTDMGHEGRGTNVTQWFYRDSDVDYCGGEIMEAYVRYSFLYTWTGRNWDSLP
eukprot:Protomagalhaensia_sp_Gyna_25__2853@NODE_265_length_4121_cov_42_148212_g205_i0_p3_GENE_NODE_265_length_4121_cov_42_148212_g205_i0NODE_265_length_4121_cov_42_148212_g205_i0_p3_ORF_typecomplete_len307_score44_70Fip1/PF05182_13/0_11Fip1/PF05182_13/1e04Fip1/PF05182_13/9_4e02_NODE_265_length_4121_cov_42_148212_g205_i019112831